ncbi:MAG: YCF48-related protein [Dehalococcoidia bacterium]
MSSYLYIGTDAGHLFTANLGYASDFVDQRKKALTESGLKVLKQEKGSWREVASAFSDRTVECIAFRGDDPSSLYVCVRHQGVFYSKEGSPWKILLEADVWAVAVSPHDPAVMYAGVEPASIFRSTDAGHTWKELAAVGQLPSAPTWTFPVPPHIPRVRTLSVDPQEPMTIYAGVEVGGVIRSRDGGESWEELNQGIDPDIHHLALHTQQPGLIYAATGDGFYRSENGGASWQRAHRGLEASYTVPLAFCSGTRALVVVGAATDDPTFWDRPEGAQAALYRSIQQGQNWEKLSRGLPASFNAMLRSVTINPARPDSVYAGTDDGELFASEDEGDSWHLIAKGLPPIRTLKVATV